MSAGGLKKCFAAGVFDVDFIDHVTLQKRKADFTNLLVVIIPERDHQYLTEFFGVIVRFFFKRLQQKARLTALNIGQQKTLKQNQQQNKANRQLFGE